MDSAVSAMPSMQATQATPTTPTTPAWPDGLLLAYYGDDFIGSTDAMEAFTAAGVPTVLFLRPPTAAWLARFPELPCVGLAGQSRGRSPEWMARELPSAFASLAALNASILHYKVCSTFDSSPATGSVGRAIDIGIPLMRGMWSPMIVGAPRLCRYQLFGNLFAAADGVGHRLDRHPTMSRHPVTPMSEADLTRHLAAQTARRIELIDMLQLRAGDGPARVRELAGPDGSDVPVVSIDVHDDETLAAAGQLVWQHAAKACSAHRLPACNMRWPHIGAARACCPRSRACRWRGRFLPLPWSAAVARQSRLHRSRGRAIGRASRASCSID